VKTAAFASAEATRQKDHHEKRISSTSSKARRRRDQANESFAMWPGSAVSAFYSSHPRAHYFASAGSADQAEICKAKGWSLAGKTEAWTRNDPQLRAGAAGRRRMANPRRGARAPESALINSRSA